LQTFAVRDLTTLRAGKRAGRTDLSLSRVNPLVWRYPQW
jgi:hypothetical protein